MIMADVPYRVCVVVDREFGERLAKLAVGLPVWIVSTSLNRAVAERLSKEDKEKSHLKGITVFNDQKASSPEDLLISQIQTIDLHHGSYSANPPYTVLDVIGTPLSAKIRAVLSEYGFGQFDDNPLGFCAVRPLPSD
jgi:hypothetical protein